MLEKDLVNVQVKPITFGAGKLTFHITHTYMNEHFG